MVSRTSAIESGRPARVSSSSTSAASVVGLPSMAIVTSEIGRPTYFAGSRLLGARGGGSEEQDSQSARDGKTHQKLRRTLKSIENCDRRSG